MVSHCVGEGRGSELRRFVGMSETPEAPETVRIMSKKKKEPRSSAPRLLSAVSCQKGRKLTLNTKTNMARGLQQRRRSLPATSGSDITGLWFFMSITLAVR